LREHAHRLDGHVLGGGQQLDLRGVAARAGTRLRDAPARVAGPLPHAAGLEALYDPSQASPAWRPVTPPSRRWEKNSSGLQLTHNPATAMSPTPHDRSSDAIAAGRSSARPATV
jgi:hypothetical protein